MTCISTLDLSNSSHVKTAVLASLSDEARNRDGRTPVNFSRFVSLCQFLLSLFLTCGVPKNITPEINLNTSLLRGRGSDPDRVGVARIVKTLRMLVMDCLSEIWITETTYALHDKASQAMANENHRLC
jgi:hypothetical protein